MLYSSKDIDVIFGVLGRSIESLGFAHPRWRRQEGMKELYQMAKDQVAYFEIFSRLILGSIEGGGGGMSSLTRFSGDPETSRQLKMKIAAYANVPYGARLRLARRVFSAAEYLISRFQPQGMQGREVSGDPHK